MINFKGLAFYDFYLYELLQELVQQ